MFQVIIQGLKESGVFSSIIASAPQSLSKKKFLASIESSNSSRADASRSLPSTRKIGTHSTARKALELAVDNTSSHEEAVPPLSPPTMDNDPVIVKEA